MFFIPGQLIAILTFPGVIAHEAGHMLFCRLKRCAVFDVCFFRVGNPAGYVVHEEPKNFSSAFWIAVGPLVVNSILCILLSFPAVIPLRIFGQPDLISYFWMWLGISIGMRIPLIPRRSGAMAPGTKGRGVPSSAGAPELSLGLCHLLRECGAGLLV